jgi:mannosyl-3-phosphoglycerate synthase
VPRDNNVQQLRVPIHRFAIEVEAVRQLGRFMDKRMIMVHQQGSGFAEVFKKSWLQLILDSEEGMVMGLLIAKGYHKDYLAFIDGDNYVPGAANEYVKIFAAGFGMSNTRYCNVRVSWVQAQGQDQVAPVLKVGRVPETANKNLNSLLSSITGFETEVIKTGYSGEHVLSTPVTECLHYFTGHSIEHYEFIEIFEKFGGLVPSEHLQIMERVESRYSRSKPETLIFTKTKARPI